MSVFPAGARQGAEVELEIQGGALDDPSSLYFSHPGITAAVVAEEPPKGEKPKMEPGKKKDPPGKCRFKVKVGADVPVGDYDVRFAGKEGLSNPRTFTVGDIAEALEKEHNNERKDANQVEVNTTVTGRSGGSEDIDWVVFAAKKGQRILVECRAWRIDSR